MTRFCIWFLQKRGWLVKPIFDGEEPFVLFRTNYKTIFYDEQGREWIARLK